MAQNPFSPALIDFSSLADLPTLYRKGQEYRREDDLREAFKDGFPRGPAGEIDYGTAYDLLAQHDPISAFKYASGHGQGGASVYGTPIYGIDPETGQTVLGAMTKDGGFQRLDTGGVVPTPGVQWQDFGSYRQPYNSRTAQPAGPAVPTTGSPPTGYVPPQQSFTRGGVGPEGGYMPGASPSEVAEQGARGKERGENINLLESMKSKLPGLYQTVQKLEDLSDKATYTTAGKLRDEGRKQLGMDPGGGAVARSEYVAIVDNQVLPLLRDTFGAQFTVEEGKSLRATLGDPDKSPQEKQAVLRAFIAQKVRDIQALSTRVNNGMPNTTSAVRTAPGGTVDVYNSGGGARPVPSQQQIQMLRQYANDPEARQTFEEFYGAGSADWFLQGGR